MKKLFLLIPILAFALMANATSTTISPGTPKDNNIRAAFNGSADTIYLNSGEYVQENQIHFKRSAVLIAVNKENKPVIHLKSYIDLYGENTKVFVDGVIFDCSEATSGQQGIRPTDAAAGKEIHLNDCEFSGFAKTVISGDNATYALDSCVVNNCKFYNNNRSCIFLQSANLVGVKVTNSTFANITNVSGGDYASPIDVRSASAKVLVDHCTMYNCATVDANYNYINVTSTSDVLVSNSIFASAEAYDCCGTYLKAGGLVTNCLTYNLTNWQGANANMGHVVSGGATLSDCIKVNPLVKDVANGDFSLYASSPARGAGLAGSDLGDPRWAKALAPISIPANLVPFDALLSDNASIIQSTPDSIFLKTESKTVIEWAKWSVSVTEDGLYDFTAYVNRTNPSGSQKLQIVVLNSAENDTLKSKKEKDLPTECTISTGAVNLTAGNMYVIKVFNNYDWAKSKLIKVEATYAGGKLVAIPDTIRPVDAIRSERAFVNEDGELRFTDDSHTGLIHDQWAKWNINVTDAGKYKFTANVNSSNGQNYRITLKNEAETSTLGTWYGPNNDSGARKIATELVDLAIGNYVLMIEDTVKYSHGRVANIVASYEGGKTVEVPGQILAKEAVIGIVENGHQKMSHLMGSGDLKYDDNGYNMEEFATWTLDVTKAGEMAVTLNVSHAGHMFSLELYQGNTRLDSIGEIMSGDDKTVWDDGDITLPDHLIFPEKGTYTLKLLNNQAHSGGALHGITFARTPIVIDENATVNGNWAYCASDETIDLSIIRTFKGGMYNTICLPIELGSTSSMNAAFGAGYELLKLSGATLNGNELYITFESVETLEYGIPHLIKPVADVVNPSFTGRKIKTTTASTVTKGVVDFIGNFIVSEVPAGENNLFLGPDDLLYFSQTATPIKGMRAYFKVNVPGAANNIKAARIVKGTQVITEIDLVGDENKAVKTIENGQLVITIDGVRYNVMGTKIQ